MYSLIHGYLPYKCVSFLKKIFIYLSVCSYPSCNTWDIVTSPGIKQGTPALGMQSLSHRTMKEMCKYLIKENFLLSFAYLLFLRNRQPKITLMPNRYILGWQVLFHFKIT